MRKRNTEKAGDELRREYDLSMLKDGVRGKYAAQPNIIVKDPKVLGGTPVFRNTRVPFQALLDYLEGGQTLDDFLNDFPTVSREAAIGALEEADPKNKDHP
jgi:uncharacterized protein (DUF433 family)